MKLLISVLNFYKEDLTFDIINQINKESKLLNFQITLCVGVNILSDGVTLDYFKKTCFKYRNKNLDIKVFDNNGNIGFGAGHNKAFKSFTSDYFLILNNDINFYESNWIGNLMNCCKDAVGLKNAPHFLNSDGSGTPDISKNRFDYIEASCLLVRSAVFQSLDGFDCTYINSYYEDSDFSLRMKFNGFKLDWIELDHHHIRGESSRDLPKEQVDEIQEINKNIFNSRWGFISSRSWKPKEKKVAITSDGIGDIIILIPILFNLKKIYGSFLVLFVNKKIIADILIFFGFRIKYINILNRHLIEFDLIKMINYSGLISPQKQSANILGVNSNFDANDINTFLKNKFYFKSNKKINKYVVFHYEYLRESTWQGRSPDINAFKKIFDYFVSNGFKIYIVSSIPPSSQDKKLFHGAVFKINLKIRELFRLIYNANYVVAIDSLISNIANVFSKKAILFFGATSPFMRNVNFGNSVIFSRHDLNCLGCYHRNLKNSYNSCLYFIPKCYSDTLPSNFTFILNEFLLHGKSFNNFKHNVPINSYQPKLNIGILMIKTIIFYFLPFSFTPILLRKIKNYLITNIKLFNVILLVFNIVLLMHFYYLNK